MAIHSYLVSDILFNTSYSNLLFIHISGLGLLSVEEMVAVCCVEDEEPAFSLPVGFVAGVFAAVLLISFDTFTDAIKSSISFLYLSELERMQMFCILFS